MLLLMTMIIMDSRYSMVAVILDTSFFNSLVPEPPPFPFSLSFFLLKKKTRKKAKKNNRIILVATHLIFPFHCRGEMISDLIGHVAYVLSPLRRANRVDEAHLRVCVREREREVKVLKSSCEREGRK